MDNPAQLGGELLCAAVGALQTHKPPLLVMNMDTAATLVAVDAEGSIVGGVILPSPALSLSALVRNTAQLPQIDMELPAKLFGHQHNGLPAQRYCERQRPDAGWPVCPLPRHPARTGCPGHCHRHPARQHPGCLRHPH